MAFREVQDIQLDAEQNATPSFREVGDIKLDEPATSDRIAAQKFPSSFEEILQHMRPEVANRLEAAARGAGQTATFNTSDEILGKIKSLTRDFSRSIESELFGDNILPPVTAQEATNAERQANKQAQEANPISYGSGSLAGGVATGVAGASTKIGGAVSNSISRGLLPKATSLGGKFANALTKIAQGSAAGATSAAAYSAGNATEGNRIEAAKQAAVPGAAIGAAIPLATTTINGLKEVATPAIDEAVKPLVQRAKDFGIRLRGDQIADSRVRNTIQKIGQELPFSGAGAFEQEQQRDFTKAVAKTIGQDTDSLGAETIKKFRKDVGEKFDSVLSGKTISVSPEDIQGIESVKTAARDNIESGLADVVDRNVDKTLKDLSAGELSGEKLASIRSQMLKTSIRAQGGAKDFIGDIVDSIDNIASKNITPEEGKVLEEARNQWRNFRTIQPLLKKSTDGQINPTQLLNKVSSSRYIDASSKVVGDDDLVDLARIGKEFLSKKGGSDTFQKAALGSGLVAGVTGAFTNPLLTLQAATTTGGVLALNRGVQAVNQSQKLIDLALKANVSGVPKIAKSPLAAIIAGGATQ